MILETFSGVVPQAARAFITRTAYKKIKIKSEIISNFKKSAPPFQTEKNTCSIPIVKSVQFMYF